MREHSLVFISFFPLPILFFVPDDLINILAFSATVVRFDQQMAAFTRDTQHQVSGPAHDKGLLIFLNKVTQSNKHFGNIL